MSEVPPLCYRAVKQMKQIHLIAQSCFTIELQRGPRTLKLAPHHCRSRDAMYF